MGNQISRRIECAGLLAILLALGPVPAGADVPVRLVHHGEMPDGGAKPRLDAVQHLMRVVEEACFERGGDVAALRSWAEYSHWAPATEAQLKAVPENEFASVVGGWTVASEFGATAIIQSELRRPQGGNVCSVTTQLPDAGLHGDAKSAFQEKFATTIDEEQDSPGQHIDRFWIERGKTAPVKATMVFTSARRIITIRMIHGSAWPLRS